MRITGKWGVAALAVVAAPAFAETGDGFDLSGTIRLRVETVSNQPRPGFNRDDTVVNLRSTLFARYQSGPFTIAGELWDSRVYGDDAHSPISNVEVDAFEPVQAYVGLKEAIGSTKVSAQAGRFLMTLGSGRLIVADDYRNTTNGFTGLRLDAVTKAGLTATAVYVLPQQRRPDDLSEVRDNKVALDHEGFDLVVWGGVVAKAGPGRWAYDASFFHLGEHDLPGRPTRDRSIDTYGGRLLLNPAIRKFDGEVEAYYQSGSISLSTAPTAGRQAVSAWFLHASAGYSLPGSLKAHLSLFYDRASGDGPGGKYGHFDTLYGSRRQDFAASGLYGLLGRANISAPGVKLDVTPSPRWDAFVSYRPLWLANAADSFSSSGVRDPSGRSGSFAGNQFDSRLRWWVRPKLLRFEVNGVLLLKGRFLETAPNAPAGKTTAHASFNLTAFL